MAVPLRAPGDPGIGGGRRVRRPGWSSAAPSGPAAACPRQARGRPGTRSATGSSAHSVVVRRRRRPACPARRSVAARYGRRVLRSRCCPDRSCCCAGRSCCCAGRSCCCCAGRSCCCAGCSCCCAGRSCGRDGRFRAGGGSEPGDGTGHGEGRIVGGRRRVVPPGRTSRRDHVACSRVGACERLRLGSPGRLRRAYAFRCRARGRSRRAMRPVRHRLLRRSGFGRSEQPGWQRRQALGLTGPQAPPSVRFPGGSSGGLPPRLPPWTPAHCPWRPDAACSRGCTSCSSPSRCSSPQSGANGGSRRAAVESTVMERYYVTTPIYYVNSTPHIGHAYTTIAADILARNRRQRGAETFFLTGVDEHAAKVARVAAEQGLSPQEYADQIAVVWRELPQRLNASNDFFIRTSDEEHKRFVQGFLQRLYDNGHVYQDVYAGLVLRRLRGVQDGGRPRRRQVPGARARAGVDRGAQLVLPPVVLRAAAARALRA